MRHLSSVFTIMTSLGEKDLSDHSPKPAFIFSNPSSSSSGGRVLRCCQMNYTNFFCWQHLNMSDGQRQRNMEPLLYFPFCVCILSAVHCIHSPPWVWVCDSSQDKTHNQYQGNHHIKKWWFRKWIFFSKFISQQGEGGERRDPVFLCPNLPEVMTKPTRKV